MIGNEQRKFLVIGKSPLKGKTGVLVDLTYAGAKNGWYTLKFDNGKEGLFAGEELREVFNGDNKAETEDADQPQATTGVVSKIMNLADGTVRVSVDIPHETVPDTVITWLYKTVAIAVLEEKGK
jgi:hypothetical protein